MNSNITNNTNGSIKDLKQQVLNDIQRVKDDLKEIKRRATPGQIIDDVIFSRREYGTEGTFDLLKANPIGTTFLTLGTLMLMENDVHQTWESVGKEKSGAVIGTVRNKVSGIVSKAESLVHRNKGNATFTTDTTYNDDMSAGFSTESSGISDFSDSSSSRVSDLKDTAGSVGQNLKGKIGGVTDGIRGTVDGIKDKMHVAGNAIDSGKAKISGVTSSVREKSSELYAASKNLDPLTYLALGIGLGAVTGAALPVPQSEEALVDRLVSDKLSTFTQELQGVLNQSVNIFKNEFIGGITDFDLFK